MHDRDEYVLIDGAKIISTNNSAVPLKGVKQGCLLSPLLFSLLINDVDNGFGSGFVGAVTGTEELRVTHMLYADDLTLTANDPVQLQKMLRRLESYAARKGLTVNVQKSYIVNFNAHRNSAVPVFRLYNQELEERDSFTYLGILFDKHMNLHHAASHALRPFNAALRRVNEFGIEKRISDRPHAMLWLFKTYVLSAGMYASQIWSTQFLKHDNGFSNPLQVAHMAFLKRILGIKSTSANWCVLRECAQEPLQFYWFRSAIKFWNRMVDLNSITLRDVMKTDISLGNSGAYNCWSRQMKDAFGDLQNGTVYRSDLFQCRKLNISNLRIDLRFRHQAVWREAHGQDPCSC